MGSVEDELDIKTLNALRGTVDVERRLRIEMSTGTPSISDSAYAIKIRVKEDYKIVEKVVRKRRDKNDPLYNVDRLRDIVGLRIVTLYRLDALTIIPLLLEKIATGSKSSSGLFMREVLPFTDNRIALVETFADQAVIAIENVRLFEEVQARTRELQEALDYQTATSDVLEVISRTLIDLQPVLTAICETVAKLCETKDAEIFIRDGDCLRLGWVQGPMGTEAETWPITRGLVMGRAVLNRELIQVHDLRAAGEEYPEGYESSLLVGHRTIIAVPLMRKGEAVGVLTLRRSEVKPFTDKQITLLRTFADQAVIAIENTRLFEEVQARNRELTESLEQQTATSEILRVISSSPTDIRPVLDAVGENAARLCDANNAVVYKLEGDILRQVSSYGGLPTTSHPTAGLPVNRDRVTGRAVFDRQTIHVHDLAIEDAEFPEGSKDARRDGHRTTLATPLLREGVPLGAILIRRMEVRPFSERQIKLLETFANQAAIAINNVGLFEQVQARSRELSESLEQQTATADVLKVISRSTFDLQQVFDTLIEAWGLR